MIVAIVRFPLPDGMDADAARAAFESSAPSYQGLPGLLRKYYVRSADGSEGGGVYLWESREAAAAAYDDTWRARLSERFDAEPQVEFLDCPVVVDPDTIVVA